MYPKRLQKVFAIIVTLYFFHSATLTAQAETVIRVPSDYSAIQSAIEAAADGDTVVVAPGVYVENINFLGKSIVVESEEGPETTVIDGNELGSVVTFNSGEGPESILRGFTVRNGHTRSSGGGVMIAHSSPQVVDNIITENTACSSGKGVFAGWGSAHIKGNTITNNRPSGCTGASGGGIAVLVGSGAIIESNTITDNIADGGGGISLIAVQNTLVRNNIIQWNSADSNDGGGIELQSARDVILTQNLIAENVGDYGGGIYWNVASPDRRGSLVHNTIVDNIARIGSGVYIKGNPSRAELINNIIVAVPGRTALTCDNTWDPNPTALYSNNFYGSGRELLEGSCTGVVGTNGNVSVDPLFVDAAQDDYHLQVGSPLIDAGDETRVALPEFDFDGDQRLLDGDGDGAAQVDIGADEFTSRSPEPVSSVVLRVPADFPTIQDAIDAAGPGDFVLVSPGLYVENIDFLGKRISVVSEDGPVTTTIDGGQNDSVVTFVSGEGPNSILRGFTLRNGRAHSDHTVLGDGGGVKISRSSPQIIGNVITANQAFNGQGISIYRGSPLIQDNVIRLHKSIGSRGGGIYISGDSASEIRGNLISDNNSVHGGGISLWGAGAPFIHGNEIRDNTAGPRPSLPAYGDGGGIHMWGSEPLIVQNVIADNSAGDGGGMYYLLPTGSQGPQLINNTIAHNTAAKGAGIFASGKGHGKLINNLIVTNNDQTALHCENRWPTDSTIFISNNAFSPQGMAYGGLCADVVGSNGNISADPLFVDALSGDYRLRAGSPAIDVGDSTVSELPVMDFDGDARVLDGNRDGIVTVDIGADEFAAQFVEFDARLDLVFSPQPNKDRMNARGFFSLDTLSNGIDLENDDVVLRLIDRDGLIFEQQLLAGSFQPIGKKRMVFKAPSGSSGIQSMTIQSTKSSDTFTFKVVGRKMGLNAADIPPPTLSLQIGDEGRAITLLCAIRPKSWKCR